MLRGLFSNRNAERILLFLFVNERCYGTQIQNLFQVPLTPVQNALLRLEKTGILNSRYEGKTRIYQFSPSYSLRQELEILLKKAYTLLSSEEKKRYCFIHKPKLRAVEEAKRDRDRNKELRDFGERLAKVHRLSFSAKTRKGEEASMRMGKADVAVTSPSSSTLVFQEKGSWILEQIPESSFSNIFRWTCDQRSALISLEHLRFGEKHPVFLFNFTSTEPYMLESVDAHLCAEDTYLGHIIWNENEIDFHCRIIGPSKNDLLIYRYS